MNTKEILKGLAVAIGLILMVSYLFYENLIASIFLSPYIIIHMKKYRERLKKQRKEKLAKEFCDTLQSVKSSLASGSSIENAFRESRREVVMINGKDCYMLPEINNMINQMSVNIPLEAIIDDFGKRSKVEDIVLFAEILKYAKRSGGNIIGIITKTIDTINTKNDVKNDIKILVSGKTYEKNIMSIMPFFMILYLKMSSKSMITPLYHNLAGILVMTVCLIIYLIANRISEKILDIEV